MTAKLVSILGVPHDPTLPAAIGRGGHEAIARAAELLERQRLALHAARPDALVVVAGDHLNQWFLDNMPAFLVGKAARSRGPFPDEVHIFGIEELDVPNEGSLARHILADGLERGIDFAYSSDYTLDHAFTVPYLFVRPERDLPTVPLFTNVLAAPLPTAQRFHDIGVALRGAIESWDGGRVAVIVTGHFTNNVGGPRMLDFLQQAEVRLGFASARADRSVGCTDNHCGVDLRESRACGPCDARLSRLHPGFRHGAREALVARTRRFFCSSGFAVLPVGRGGSG